MLNNVKAYRALVPRCVTLFVLGLYFALTLVYVSPTNPLRTLLSPLLDTTIGAYFPQDWNLFAPVPRTADLALLVRPLDAREVRAIKTQGLPSDKWYNLSAPLWNTFQSHRFSAYNRLGRPADQAISHYLTQPQQQSIELMVRIASAFCKDTGQNQASFVALVISERLSKPWLERDTARPREVRMLFVGVYPIDKNVEKMNLYHLEEKYEHIP